MDNSQKSTPLLRILFLSRILIILLLLAIAFIFWNRNNRKLHDSIDVLSYSDPSLFMLEKGTLRLYQADNNFRYYIITYNKDYFRSFANDVRYVSSILDSINQTTEAGAGNSINGMFERKSDVAQMLINLKRLTDSLLNLSLRWDTNQMSAYRMPAYDINKLTNFRKMVSIDTVSASGNKKKSFFQKVKQLFKEEENGKAPTIVKRSESVSDSTYTDQISTEPENALLKDIHKYYLKKFSDLADGRNRLNSKERELADINLGLISQMQVLFASLKQKEMERVEAVRSAALMDGSRSAARIAWISLFAFALAAAFYFLIMYYVQKIKNYNLRLNREHEQYRELAETSEKLLTNLAHNLDKISQAADLQKIIDKIQLSDKQKDTCNSIVSDTPDIRLFSQQFNDYLSSVRINPSGKNVSFSPYRLFSSVTGEKLEDARKHSLMIHCDMPVKEEIQLHGDPDILRKIIHLLTDHAIATSRNDEIHFRVHIEKSSMLTKLTSELFLKDHVLVLPDKDTDLEVPFSVSYPAGEEHHCFNLVIVSNLVKSLKGQIRIAPCERDTMGLVIEIPYPDVI